MLTILSKFKTIGVSCLILLHGTGCANVALAICYSTPADAIGASTASSPSSLVESGGYRVARIQSDPVLGQTWAMVVPCGHPEWPTVALPLHGSIFAMRVGNQERAQNIRASLMIRAGDVVRLWRQESTLRIEVTGISEGNGGLGDLIKIRLLHRSTDDQSVVERFYGIVRGPSDVEMKP